MSFVIDSAPTTSKTAIKMSLSEFMKSAGGEKINAIFRDVTTGSYMECHVAFYEATGIWIPELQDAFQKMDAIVVMGEKVLPKELR